MAIQPDLCQTWLETPKTGCRDVAQIYVTLSLQVWPKGKAVFPDFFKNATAEVWKQLIVKHHNNNLTFDGLWIVCHSLISRIYKDTLRSQYKSIKDVNECSNIRIFVFRSNIRIRFLNSNIHIFICPRSVLLLSFQMKNYRPALKVG